MSNIGPSRVSQYVFNNFDFECSPIKLTEYITSIVLELDDDVSEVAAYEKVSSNKDKFFSELKSKRNEAREKGRFCPYEIFPKRDLIVGYSYEKPDDTEEEKQIRAVAPYHAEILEHIRSLGSDVFEDFCAKVLTLFEASLSVRTRQSDDEGVDFVARIPLDESSNDFSGPSSFFQGVEITIVGQSKSYSTSNKVDVSEIRELIGSYFMFRSSYGDVGINTYDIPFGITLCEPIVPMFMTTGFFTKRASRRASEHGVIIKDGSQLATLLCLNRIGLRQEDGEFVVDTNCIDNWVENLSG